MNRFLTITLIWTLGMVLATVGLSGPQRLWTLAGLSGGYALIVLMGIVWMRLNLFCTAVMKMPPGHKRIALTFDDGPDPEVTGPLLDALKELNVQAMFFCVGHKVENHPELARRIIAEGHAMGNHTFRHTWWSNFQFARALRKEIADTQRAIGKATGIRPRFFRPPMGLTSPHLTTALKDEGMTPIGWSIRSFDLGSAQPDAIVRRILRKIRDGSVILLHDRPPQQYRLVEIVTSLVNGAREMGFSFHRLDLALEADKHEPPPGQDAL